MSRADIAYLLKVFARALADGLPSRPARAPSTDTAATPGSSAECLRRHAPTDDGYLN
ncbi:MAG TPA: hypothetical protein PLP01_16655 [Phycisphaerae bacterium]|nr:hypothetical protein [Phycisphaerae bacterium]